MTYKTNENLQCKNFALWKHIAQVIDIRCKGLPLILSFGDQIRVPPYVDEKTVRAEFGLFDWPQNSPIFSSLLQWYWSSRCTRKHDLAKGVLAFQLQNKQKQQQKAVLLECRDLCRNRNSCFTLIYCLFFITERKLFTCCCC